MLHVTFHAISSVDDNCLKIAVIVSRFQDKWIFCRHKRRSTWEIPGGHREPNETIEQTARRELFEETGATDIQLQPVCVYNVVRDGKDSFGMLYFARIGKIGALPKDSEMTETVLMDTVPSAFTYPDIQLPLFDRVQGWLNLCSNAGELWDVYDTQRRLTGRTHRRGDPLLPGDYHLVVYIWIRNSQGQYLLTKRSSNKGFPNLWETTGGSALTGDDSLTAALREVREETGLTLDPACGQIVRRFSEEDFHADIWLFRQEFDLEKVVLQEGETCDKMSADRDQILALERSGLFVPFYRLEELLNEFDKG